jgi:hypothetical protein
MEDSLKNGSGPVLLPVELGLTSNPNPLEESNLLITSRKTEGSKNTFMVNS